ncbi:MAG: LLM class flavin-dependent oxidoreductase [Candidatus Sulfopaludibacter sp.]|nr:LLM class flavin-dependent oxidoreductase [Candidatus Sulfopaludibacter sp.]
MPLIRQPRYSVLDLAPVRAGGTVAEALRNTLDLARHAERWGFTRFWMAEHHNMPGVASAATSILIGYVAAQTATIRVGSGGVMLPNHAALVIAEQFGTLETLYPGRIDLGVGRAPGSDDIAARALRYDTAEENFPAQVSELLAYLAPARPGQRLIAFPGAGTNVPVWLLGSTTYSAELAASLGLPFAFASHFAPALLMEALETYRGRFQPSQYLERPYVMAGVPLVAAASDTEAERLATSPQQRHLQLIRRQPVFVPPPVESMAGMWSEAEKFAVQSRLGVAVVGGPETVRRRLAHLLRDTGADELIFTSDLYDHALRLRSFEIAADAMKQLAGANPLVD